MEKKIFLLTLTALVTLSTSDILTRGGGFGGGFATGALTGVVLSQAANSGNRNSDGGSDRGYLRSLERENDQLRRDNETLSDKFNDQQKKLNKLEDEIKEMKSRKK